MEKLTKREKQVLIELTKNCKTTDQEIAKRLGTSRPTVFKIRKRIERKNIITGYSTMVNFEKIGLNIQAFIMYSWKDYSRSNELKKTMNFIKSLPEVMLFVKGEGFGGKTDLIISAHNDLKDYETFIRKLKYEFKNNVDSIEVFLSSFDGIFKGYDLVSPVVSKIKKSVIYSE